MRSKMIFFLALIMGGFTTLLFFSYINKSDEAEGKSQEAFVEVVTAEQSIEGNQVITEEMLKLVNVPENTVHQMAVKEMSEVAGKHATTLIEAGEVILSHRLKSDEEETQFVSRKVKEGYRAVSIGGSNIQLVTNLIDPEDYVDVIYTPDEVDENEEPPSPEVILSEVRVLSVGENLISEATGEQLEEEYDAVTLELKPEEAILVIDAYQTGGLHLMLHSSLIHAEEAEE